MGDQWKKKMEERVEAIEGRLDNIERRGSKVIPVEPEKRKSNSLKRTEIK